MDREDQKREDRDSKPTPAREVKEGSRPDSQGRARGAGAPASPASSAPGLRGQRERPRGPGGQGRSRGRGRPRSRSREGLVPAREALERPCLESTRVEDLPSRKFDKEGRDWIVRLAGRTTTGSASDTGAPLLHLLFCSAGEPSVPIRETLSVGDSLDALGEDQLALLFESARLSTPPDRHGEAPQKPSP